MSGRVEKEPKETSGRRRKSSDGQGGKSRRKRGDAAKVESHIGTFHTLSVPDAPWQNIFFCLAYKIKKKKNFLTCSTCGPARGPEKMPPPPPVYTH